MSTDHRATLANIKRFDQLIAYLRDEMGWPIARDSFEDVEDLFYDFTADELGIDPKTAAKIESIKRLRPLSTNQPWGIFFVKFEPKKLPVVALRRILSQVVLKKRATPKAAERAAWAADDLLFISNYGEGDERRITFAHFSQPEASYDLPTLKVLGWDNLDTPLHLDVVAKELTRHLAWPEDEHNIEAWRLNWRSAFTLRHRQVITTSRDLSIRLAELARAIRDRIKTTLAIETERGALTKLMKAFQASLVHDLDAGGFADMYAQTIAYGLLSARIADPHKKTVDDFAGHMRTNPFLRELMETFLKIGGRRGKSGGPGIDFDELGVNEVVELLDNANMEAVIRDFGDRNPQEDPVIHFYELFLKEYDAKKRMQRGVFYTPRPVVSYIVRSVDELLHTEFGLVDGLADTTTWGEMVKRHKDLRIPEGVSGDQAFVQILDPATGTGTFLVEVIEAIHKTLIDKWQAQGHDEKRIEALWNEYVPKHLLPRLHGYELLMAPYAIAHLKIGLKLYETGYRFESDERARIYLTNALEPAHDFSGTFAFAIPALAHEVEAVNKIKWKQRFTVVIGNPPYSRVSQNRSDFIQKLLRTYKEPVSDEANQQPLDDDYIKFIRLAHHLQLITTCGIIGFITNHTVISGILFRGVRQRLIEDQNFVGVLDLHGNSNTKEKCPDGSKDENVFDIQAGVAITVAIKAPWLDSHQCLCLFQELWGFRDVKYLALQKLSVRQLHQRLTPIVPYFFLSPIDLSVGDELNGAFSLPNIFPTYSSGLMTVRDNLSIALDRDQLRTRFEMFRSTSISDAQFLAYCPVKNYRKWSITEARRKVRADKKWENRIELVNYRPFDKRWIFYSPDIITYPNFRVMDQFKRKNIGLISSRIHKGEEHAHEFATREMVEIIFLSSKSSNNAFLFPLYTYGTEGELALVEGGAPNLSRDFLKQLASNLGLRLHSGSGFPEGLTPEDIFHYTYATLHSPGFRSRYAAILRFEFPRVPLTENLVLFRTLANLGGELVALHLLESPKLDHFITEFIGGRNPEVGRVGWSDNTVWLDAAATKKGQHVKPGTIGFKGVPEAVWNFHIGGYQVCEKWLKDRKGRILSKDDITHYQKIVVALSETIRLMKEIDKVIDKHGGWPGAFALNTSTSAAKAHEVAETSLDKVFPLHPEDKKTEATSYVYEPEPLLKAAESPDRQYEVKSNANKSAEQTERPEEIDREELFCFVRQTFSDGMERERNSAINELARALGYQRTSSRVYEELDNALRTAVRRGILENKDGTLRIFVRSIEQYDRDFLKEQFLAALIGRQWTEREEAIRGFARWMGFRRAGPSIDETARSLIKGLIREGRLESDGSIIRRAG